MRHTFQKTAALLLCLTLLLSLTACGRTEEAEDEGIEIGDTISGQVLTTGSFADDIFSLAVDFEDTLNPLRTRSSASLTISGLVFDNFFEVDARYNLSSRICTEYSVNDEGNFWTFVVDTSIPMHDGSTLTAYDVGYSLNRALMYSDHFASRLGNVNGVSAYSETELCISTKYADTQLPYRLTIPIIKYGSILSNAPAGSGPYQFAYSGAVAETPEEDAGETESEGEEENAAPTPSPSPTPEPELLPDMLVAFPAYTGAESVPLDTIYLRQYQDPATTIEEYESGLVDLVVNDPTGIYNMGYGGKNEKRVFPTTNMHYIGFNGYSRFFCYAQYRSSMTYIIDRDTIVNSIMDGAADAAVFPINPASPLYDTELASAVDFGHERCLQELDWAGCSNLDDDEDLEFSLSGSKVEISIDFIVCADSATKVTAARQIAQDMRAIGLPVTLRELSWKEFRATLLAPLDEENKPTFDMYYDEVALTADWDLKDFFAEVDEDTVAYYGTLNYGRWPEPSVTESISAYLAADNLTRAEACGAMCQKILEQGPFVPICFERRVVISHLGVIRGMDPNQYNIFNGIGNWSIKTGT